MSEALTAPFLLAASVLCVAGVAKLRAPLGAARAARILGLPGGMTAVRAFAAGELALGGWGLAAPSDANAAAIACVYSLFTALTVLLARRQASCGCFGTGDAPASPIQAILSGALALTGVLALASLPHGLGWILERPAVQVVVLLLGTAGAAYGAVLAYTELPRAWASWSGS